MPSHLPFRVRRGLHEYVLVSPRDIHELRDRDTAERIVRDSNVEPEHAEALLEALLAGSHVAVRIDSSVRLLDDPIVRPLVDPTKPVIDDDARPTWISVEVVHTAGLITQGIELSLGTADGRELHGRLGAGGRWRSDEVVRGSCSFALLDHATLRARPRVVGSAAVADGESVWEVGKTRELELAATVHHRILVVSPRALRFSA